MPRLHNILVANRGEIALRIMRSARALGYGTTAIYSTADADAPHVAFADAAVCVGPAPVTESYLCAERIVDAARRAGADAVHPGYGLLSENAAFARACGDAGLTFIGPRPETIELMGDKRRARIAVRAQGVACVPGYDGEDQSDATLLREAEHVGFPIMVKAAAGGGGRGIRHVTIPGELPEAIARARSEAQKAFGDGRLILERAIRGARHIEIQIFADSHGNVIHLGERDCSAQRRFQKLIEESPSPVVSQTLRERMGQAAVSAARSTQYLGAGTVEMLLEASGEFFFLEMNTRLQVEHPVTELVTGHDLVAWQLRVAEGEPLPIDQASLRLTGHAIEARLYAEDPGHNFIPATGRILAFTAPPAPFRTDHALQAGLTVSAHYDALLAKLIAHGSDREQARRRLLTALSQLRLLGVQTNQGFLQRLLEEPSFIAGEVATDFIERSMPHVQNAPSRRELAAAATVVWLLAQAQAEYPPELSRFTNSAGLTTPLVLECQGERQLISITAQRRGPLRLQLMAEEHSVQIEAHTEGSTTLSIDGVRERFDHAPDGDMLFLHTTRGPLRIRDITYAPAERAEDTGEGRARAPMDGVVVDVPVVLGQHVERGQTLVVVEAMKLELRVSADAAGTLSALHVTRGTQVKARQLLAEVRPDDVAR